MLYGLVIAIHVIASLMLIAVILLQAGRGGGLSETFGGSSTQTILGTKTSVFLKRATAASAVIYIFTCLTLAVLTSHRGRSLVSQGKMAAPISQGTGAPMPFADEPMDF
ncbi:MAG: preprotein translocase subunit SecG [Candidatus Omnitrophota bacterium]